MNLDTILKPFIMDLIMLHDEGFEFIVPGQNNSITIHVHALISTVDAVARAVLQNIHQFNGEYGCSFCLHPGKHIAVKNGHSRVYCGDLQILRSIEQHERDIEKVLQTTEKSVHGVKEPCISMLIPNFSVTNSFPPDHMHGVLLGVTKMFFCEWFDTSNNNETWYLGKHIPDINAKLVSINPSIEIDRVPRIVQERKFYKVSEWRNWLLYYSVICLEN